MAEWSFEQLDRSHQRKEFCCGRPALDDFLRSLVSQYERRRLGRTYVAVRPGEKQVFGYYTLSSGSVPFDHVPTEVSRKLPRHPIPVVLIGRLAVDQSVQGQGLGKFLMLNALHRCLELSTSLGIYAVEVNALDEQAQQFYVKYGFTPLQDHALHLFLPISSIETLLG